MFHLKSISIILVLMGLTAFIGLAFPKPAMAQYSQSAHADSLVLDMAYSPAESTARDAATYQSDKHLTNKCIESGHNKADCLCLTRIFKYELSLKDYKVLAFIFKPDLNETDNDETANNPLMSGYSQSETQQLKSLGETIFQSPNFDSRCSQAQRYYASDNKG